MSCWNRSWTLRWGPAGSPLSQTTACGSWLEAVPAAPSTPLPCLRWGWGPSRPSWAAGPFSVPARCTSSHCPPAVPCPCLPVLPLLGVPRGSLPLGSSRCCCPAGAQTTLTTTSLLPTARGHPKLPAAGVPSVAPVRWGGPRGSWEGANSAAGHQDMLDADSTGWAHPEAVASQPAVTARCCAHRHPACPTPETSPELLGRGTAGL